MALIISVFIFLMAITTTFLHAVETTQKVQVYEYRLDKIWLYIKRSPLEFLGGAKRFTFHIAIIFGIIFFFLNNSWLVYVVTLLYLKFLIYDLIKLGRKLYKRQFDLPSLKPRNLIILGIFDLVLLLPLAFLLFQIYQTTGFGVFSLDLIRSELENFELSGYLYNTPNGIPIQKMVATSLFAGAVFFSTLISVFQPVFIALFAFLTHPLAGFKRFRIVRSAKKKIDSEDYKDLVTIGITGSYGKTNVKEILQKLLAKKFDLLTTPENKNTAVGIALTIKNLLKPKHTAFVAEMGAYRKNEIYHCTKLVPLNIAVITNIGKAHLDLFGSQDNILKAKTEILNNLKPDHKIVFNYDDKRLLDFSKKLDDTQFLFFSESKYAKEVEKNPKNQKAPEDKKEKLPTNVVFASNVKWNELEVSFDLTYKKSFQHIKTTLIGKQLFPNLLAAITVAIALKIKLKDVAKILNTNIFDSSHFKITQKESKILIDDSYNSNHIGFEEATKYLKSLKSKKKIIITKGLKEIDTELQVIYKDLVPKLVASAKTILTSDERLYEELTWYQNENDIKMTSIFAPTNAKMLAEFDKLGLEKVKSCAVLIEGRIHPDLHAKVLKIFE